MLLKKWYNRIRGDVMRFIYAQPATMKFKWQMEVAITNLLSLGVHSKDIYVLFATEEDGDISYDARIPDYIRNKYAVNVYGIPDKREEMARRYIPSIKPYLLGRFFDENPKETPFSYMYQDSDVVYRALPDFKSLQVDATHWYGSDVSSYLDANYIDSKGSDLLDRMCDCIDIDSQVVRDLNEHSIGAQLLFNSSPASLWYESYQKSYTLYNYLDSIESEYTKRYVEEGRPKEYPVQKWTAQMWTDLWVPASHGIKMTPSKELDFAWATDTYQQVQKKNIYHDAGVGPDDKDKFYKGSYNYKLPFHDDFNYVDQTSGSWFYVQQIEKVAI